MKNKIIYYALFLYAIIAVLTIYFFNGTGDSGDSITHYLYAKYAPLHHELFFNHWAKPLYVLLACPFAQFGFIGIKVFNVIVSTLSLFFTFKIVQALGLKNSVVVVFISVFSPLNFILTFSGLTEPLFALFLSVSIYLLVTENFICGTLFASFLPFVRSEGLIIIGVLALFLLLKRKWKLIPLLLVGHLVYSVAGFFVYHDFLWVFTQNPYSKLSSAYGNGELFHFIDQLIYVIGVPVYILFWLGLLVIIWKSFRKKTTLETRVLILFCFLAFFVAHTLFWYLGIFNSMGLKRVFVAVIPLISIIALMGFNFITEEVLKNKNTIKISLQILLIGYVFIFPFTSNHAAIHWDKDLRLQKDQQIAIQIADMLSDRNCRFVFSHPYLSETLGVDFFDDKQRIVLTPNVVKETKTGDIIVWENWFAVVENGVSKTQLDNSAELQNIYNIQEKEGDRDIQFSVYQRK